MYSTEELVHMIVVWFYACSSAYYPYSDREERISEPIVPQT